MKVITLFKDQWVIQFRLYWKINWTCGSEWWNIELIKLESDFETKNLIGFQFKSWTYKTWQIRHLLGVITSQSMIGLQWRIPASQHPGQHYFLAMTNLIRKIGSFQIHKWLLLCFAKCASKVTYHCHKDTKTNTTKYSIFQSHGVGVVSKVHTI